MLPGRETSQPRVGMAAAQRRRNGLHALGDVSLDTRRERVEAEAAGAFLAGFVVVSQPSVNPAPSGSLTAATRDRDPRGDGWVAPLSWTDGLGQADPSHLRLRRT